jgi:hypothetical protein
MVFVQLLKVVARCRLLRLGRARSRGRILTTERALASGRSSDPRIPDAGNEENKRAGGPPRYLRGDGFALPR